jgi:pimeloyl-ACP methyl ester carboxylesterase
LRVTPTTIGNNITMGLRRAAMLATIAAVLTTASCGSSGSHSAKPSKSSSSLAKALTAAPTFTSIPADLTAFYRAPDPLPSVPPGTLLKEQKVSAPTLHGTTYRVMYTSESVQNQTVAVTGTVIVPNTKAPAGGYPVITWGHGTNGMADQCAPSLDPNWTTPPQPNDLLDRGLEITASDYQGEGTRGVLPYLAGVSAARNTIDIVRAARQLRDAHAGTNYVVWGYSEGGQTALFALDIASAYAPELHLVGDVAGGAPSQFDQIYSDLKSTPSGYYILMMAIGLNVAYGDTAAPLHQFLTPAGFKLIPELEQRCIGFLEAKRLSHVSLTTTTKGDPFTIPSWRNVLMANDAENFTTPNAAPLLIVQGAIDTVILPATSAKLQQHLCSIGQDVERWVYPGTTHVWALTTSSRDTIRWIANQFASGSKPAAVVPTGTKSVAVTRCPA